VRNARCIQADFYRWAKFRRNRCSSFGCYDFAFNVGPRFVIPSIYGYKRICTYIRLFLQCRRTCGVVGADADVLICPRAAVVVVAWNDTGAVPRHHRRQLQETVDRIHLPHRFCNVQTVVHQVVGYNYITRECASCVFLWCRRKPSVRRLANRSVSGRVCSTRFNQKQ